MVSAASAVVAAGLVAVVVSVVVVLSEAVDAIVGKVSSVEVVVVVPVGRVASCASSLLQDAHVNELTSSVQVPPLRQRVGEHSLMFVAQVRPE